MTEEEQEYDHTVRVWTVLGEVDAAEMQKQMQTLYDEGWLPLNGTLGYFAPPRAFNVIYVTQTFAREKKRRPSKPSRVHVHGGHHA